jgi:hypothetical protein
VVALASVSCVFKLFISEGGLVIGRSFKVAEAGVADDITEVDRHNLRQRLIIYKLKSLSAVINSLIFTSDHSIGLSP